MNTVVVSWPGVPGVLLPDPAHLDEFGYDWVEAEPPC